MFIGFWCHTPISSFLTWHPRLARRKVRTDGEMGAAPVTITLTRPPRDSCRKYVRCFQNHSSQEHHSSSIHSKTLPTSLWGYLHFVKDEFVPYAVIPDNALVDLCTFPLNGKVQKPFLKWSLGPTLNLRRQQKVNNERLLENFIKKHIPQTFKF